MSDQQGEVTIVDIKMRFGSMVLFMVKWAIAAIPALIILGIAGSLVSMLVIAVIKAAGH